MGSGEEREGAHGRQAVGMSGVVGAAAVGYRGVWWYGWLCGGERAFDVLKR